MMESQQPQGTNVIPMKPEYSLFSRPLRHTLEANLKPLTSDPKAAVDSFEQTLSLFIVANIKKVVARWANTAGKTLAKRVAGA